MFVPPQVQALGLRKDIETEEGMLDFIKKAADHRRTTSSDEGGRNKKIYQAGKTPNLLHIFGGPELPASRFQGRWWGLPVGTPPLHAGHGGGQEGDWRMMLQLRDAGL